MTDIIILFSIILLVVIIIRVVTTIKQKQTKKLLKELDTFSFKKIDIRFLQSSVGKGAVVGGMSIKATMYFSDNLILITNNNGGISLNLPVIIVKDMNEIRKISFNGNIVKPDSVNITSWNSITMKYQRQMISTVEYTIQISLLDKTDFEKISSIKNWC